MCVNFIEKYQNLLIILERVKLINQKVKKLQWTVNLNTKLNICNVKKIKNNHAYNAKKSLVGGWLDG